MSSDRSAAPSDEGAAARVRSVGAAGRERLAALIEATLNRVFDAPLDIRNPAEALLAVDTGDASGAPVDAVRKAAQWGTARAVAKVGARFGSKAAGRLALPVTVAIEFGLNARDGLRELQVLASFLINRLRTEGYPVDHELVRRAVLAIYLDPTRRPDLRVPLHRRALGVAKRWSVNTLPLTGRRASALARRRVETIAGLYLSVLVEDWARVQAIDTTLAPSRTVLEGRVLPTAAPQPAPVVSPPPTHPRR